MDKEVPFILYNEVDNTPLLLALTVEMFFWIWRKDR